MREDERQRQAEGERQRRRIKNLVLGLILAAFVLLIYLVSLVRMGG